jgi:hypothetical protein
MRRQHFLHAASVLLALVMIVATATDASAFNQVHARQLSMGGAAATTFRGTQVIGWNPGLLALRDNPKFSFSMPLLTPNLGLRLSNDFISLDEINTYFTPDKFLTEQDKDDLLNEMTGESWDFYIDGYVPLFAMSFQTKFAMLALSADMGVSSDWRFSKQFVEMAFKGNGLDYIGQERDFSDTDMRFNSATRIGLTFARGFDKAFRDVEWIDEVTFGFTAGYLFGHGYGDVVDGSMTLFYDVGQFSSSGLMKVVNAGSVGNGDSLNVDLFDGNGVGLDMGVAAKILDGRGTVGISIINLLGTIRYSNSQLRYYSFDTDAPLPLDGSLTNPEQFIDKNFEMVDSLTEDYGAVDVELPRVLHLNGGLDIGNSLHVATNLRATLNDAPGGKQSVRFGGGVQYSGVPVLPMRLGASVGGRGGFSYGVGFGLHLGWWHTDIGWAWERGFLNSANGLHMAINSVFFFGSNESLETPRIRRRD